MRIPQSTGLIDTIAEEGWESQTVDYIKAVGAWWQASGQISSHRYMQYIANSTDAVSETECSSDTGKTGALCPTFERGWNLDFTYSEKN